MPLGCLWCCCGETERKLATPFFIAMWLFAEGSTATKIGVVFASAKTKSKRFGNPRDHASVSVQLLACFMFQVPISH